jgi:hypothetical protein
MKHFVVLVIVALATLIVMFALYRPDLLEDVWLWLVGLAGPIIATVQGAVVKIKQYLQDIEFKKESQS